MLETRKIFLTYFLGGKYLVKRGNYSSAKISRGAKTITYDCGMVDRETIIDVPSKVIDDPEYAESSIKVILPSEFVERALEVPVNPHKKGTPEYHRYFRSNMGKLLMEWPKLSEKQKIQRHVEIYVSDMTGLTDITNGRDYSFEIL